MLTVGVIVIVRAHLKKIEMKSAWSSREEERTSGS